MAKTILNAPTTRSAFLPPRRRRRFRVGDGMESTRAMARRYLPDAMRLLAGIAFAPDSEAALHTKMLCAKEIVAIAGVIPQATPAPPQPHDEDW